MSNDTYEQLSFNDANIDNTETVVADLDASSGVGETSPEDVELNWLNRAKKVQYEATLIKPRLFGSKIELSQQLKYDFEAELNRQIENPASTSKNIDSIYKKYTGFDSSMYYLLEKLGKNPKYEIKSKSATAIGELIVQLYKEISDIQYAGNTKKDNYKSVISILSKDIEEATYPPEFGRTLITIEDLDTISTKEARGLSELIEHLEKQIEAIPSRFN